VRKFYENIKIATQQGAVNRFFVTGVSPVTLDSLTSGFNIVTHLTHNVRFHNLMGFSEAEVAQLLDLALEDKSQKENILADMRAWYNGYKFNVEAKETVYNANMSLYFLREYSQDQKMPNKMLDPNVMPDYGKLKSIFEMANYQENLEVLQEVLEKGQIACEQIYQFDFSKPFRKKEFINFLYYLGNLTIKGESDFEVDTVFKIPNYVIQELYWQYYGYLLEEKLDFKYQDDQIKETIIKALGGDIYPFLRLAESVLKELSNRDFQRFDEKYVKMLLITFAMQGKAFYVISERETKGGGYTDLELYRRPSTTKPHHQYIFEIKYLKKEEESRFEAVKAAAVAQLKHYLTTDETVQKAVLMHAFVVIFVKDSLYVEEVFNL
jgi:hypothetical protein